MENFNASRPLADRVLFAALALRAVALALRAVPDLNGQFVGGRFRRSEAIHVGVVTSLRGGGVVVPAVHDADRLTLPELMASLRDVVARARSGRLRSSDLADSTITLTNLGDLGVETVFGVIYPPQVALVGLGRVFPRATVRDGAIAATRAVNATLSGDHRVTDGLAGARFWRRCARDSTIRRPRERSARSHPTGGDRQRPGDRARGGLRRARPAPSVSRGA
ncbi:MAG: 2-oxo acid dehydrogenase subunit E2 [Burkholderiaceae bacterium]|nr:2-oxo acid dehydrogenase subunit E2 [Burkholderiaceae bacterium]